MKLSLCHYSFHRAWGAEKWDARRLVVETKNAGFTAVDFHAGLLTKGGWGPDRAAAEISAALDGGGLSLSGLSLSNDFNQADGAKFQEQIDTVLRWLDVAAAVNAPVCRIFGGHLGASDDRAEGDARVRRALGVVVKEAERLKLVLALENHGGLPCTGEEQAELIRHFASPGLRATIDVGNYLMGDQEGHVGTRLVAPLAAYVHLKDYERTAPGRGGLKGATLGDGIVDHRRCIEELDAAGYRGTYALEYEGYEEERLGISRSLAHIRACST
jgi:sugar phosphate isomerase/epimerase